MAVVLNGTTNDITVNGVSVATDAEVSSAVASGVASAVSSAVPAGTIITVAKNTAPAGYLKANGALLSRTTYSALFEAIGTTFGAGDGSTTFALPDMRGYFPRGWDDGRGIDTSRVFGSAQADTSAFSGYTITSYQNRNNWSYATGSTQGGNLPTAFGSGGTETRPKNIALLYCIKY